MIVHGRQELLDLASQCQIQVLAEVSGWQIERWDMDDGDVQAAVAVYAAVLEGGATDPVLGLLGEAGIDLNAYLIDAGDSKEDITRADLTELTAAASLIAVPGCEIDMMQMPNVPKMSRRKSESGLDVTVVNLREDVSDETDLQDGERLTIVSVKHTVGNSAGGMRWKLVDSLSDGELSHVYLAGQLRVLNAQLRTEGRSAQSAARVYLFMRDFPQLGSVDLYAVGVTDPDLADDLIRHVQRLPAIDKEDRIFRMIFLPGLRIVHERCA